jgi:hypothetical protein
MLWIALAVVVVVSGWVGVHMVGQALVPKAAPVLSHGEMEALLATADPQVTPRPSGDGDVDHDDQTPGPGQSTHGPQTPPPDKGSPSASASPSEPGVTTVYRTFRSRGGSAVVSCTGSRIALASWSPSVGYRTAEKQQQASEVEVTFQGPAGESNIQARCVSGTPVVQIDSGGESGDG